jgi:PAS domain S-box-containing protein
MESSAQRPKIPFALREWPHGDGEMAARIRTFDWSHTPLGPLDRWPQSLRITVDLCLGSALPSYVWWGPELIQFYNDAALPIVRTKHLAALGLPARVACANVWQEIGGLIERVAATGEAVSGDDVPVMSDRGGAAETAWFIFSYSPVRDEHGSVAGVFCTAVETTNRIRAEEALGVSEGQFRALVTASSDLLFRMSADWGEMSNLKELDFITDTERPRRDWLELYIPREERSRVLDAVRKAIRNKSIFDLEHRVSRVDGTEGWASSRAVPLVNGDGEISEWFGATADITERRRAEEAPRTDEKRTRGQKEAFQAAINGAPLADALGMLSRLVTEETAGEARTAFYIVDADGARLHPIRGAGTMPAAYTEQVDGFVIGAESLACGLASATGRPVLTPDVFAEPQWGPWAHLAREYDFRGCWSFPIATRDGKPVGTFAMYFSSARDATAQDLARGDVVTQAAAIILAREFEARERARAEEDLRASEAGFRALADLVPDLLWSTDPSGQHISYNQRWRDYTGQTLEQTLGSGWIDAIHPDDQAASQAAFARAFAAAQPLELEHRIRRADGAYRWFLIRHVPVRDETGRITQWFGAATNIHEQRTRREELEARVAAATAELRALSRRLLAVQEEERRRLARELHDEIGQALTGLLLRLRTARTAHDGHRDEALTAAETLVQEVTVQVRTLSRDLRPATLDLLGLLPALVELVARVEAATDVTVDLRHEGLERRFSAEVEIAAYRIVQETLTNVARHAAAHKAIVQLLADEEALIVAIRDDGIGFTPLQSTCSGGLGGMSERVELLNGTVDIESAPGAGTTITAEIPLRAAAPAPAGAE